MDKQAARGVIEQALSQHTTEYGSYFLFNLLGLEVTYTEEGCTVFAPVREFLCNSHGVMHGGILATIMDMSMGQLLLHHYGVGGATLEMKVQYLQAVSSGAIRCEARFLRSGRSVAFLEARISDEKDALVAAASATWKPFSKKP